MTDLDDAIRSFPINAWLSTHTSVRDGGGRNLYADCPVCGGSQKLCIRKETLRFRCFKCDDGGHARDRWRGWGSIFYLIEFLEGFKGRGQAVRFLVERSGIPDVQIRKLTAPLKKLPSEAFPLKECPTNHPAVKALARRGLEHLTEKVYVAIRGPYSNRWILQCGFMGKLEGFEAKAWHKAKKPKALYPTWFKPQETVYTTAWDSSLPMAIVTESVFDAETFRVNALGLYGSTLLPGQLDRLIQLRREYGVTQLFWALDPDAAQRQQKAIVEKTSALFRNFTLPLPKLTVSGEKSDPNALGHEACIELLGQAREIKSDWDLLEQEVGGL